MGYGKLSPTLSRSAHVRYASIPLCTVARCAGRSPVCRVVVPRWEPMKCAPQSLQKCNAIGMVAACVWWGWGAIVEGGDGVVVSIRVYRSVHPMLDTFKAAICTDIEALRDQGTMPQAEELSRLTGQHFYANHEPLFFNGDLESPIVLVHLNPKQQDASSGNGAARTVEAYFAHYHHLGQILYGLAASRRHKSPFDHKQVRFLKPFGVIDFVAEHTEEDIYTNLVRVLDHKLQLELIPYQSHAFSAKGLTDAILRPHLERVLDVISACPRRYVLFCGAVFERCLRDHITETHHFKLRKRDGQLTRNAARFSTLCFMHHGQRIHAGLAHSFAQHGIPMTAYGQQCHALYRNG